MASYVFFLFDFQIHITDQTTETLIIDQQQLTVFSSETSSYANTKGVIHVLAHET